MSETFRLRPRKPVRIGADGTARAFRQITRQAKRLKRAIAIKTRPKYSQRCSVRAQYSKNTTPGQWAAHGRYVTRESATMGGAGFSSNIGAVDIPKTLGAWQSANDPRMWKLIVSPEFGDRVELEKLTRALMARMERDLGTRLEWVAVPHHNTDHKHVHVALRGLDAYGKEVRLDPEYVKNGLRGLAEELCTRQLGYRTQLDAQEAWRREIGQNRFTSLDRAIKRDLKADSTYTAAADSFRAQCIAQRLRTLEAMGLAERKHRTDWVVRPDFEQMLRAAQKGGDRQKTLIAHGVTVSDQRLAFEVLDVRQLRALEGPVLVHGEDEGSGRSYSMIESTAGKLVLVNHTPELQAARAQGKMRPNSFVRISKEFVNGKPHLQVHDFGKADQLLTNKRYFAEKARTPDGRRASVGDWKGWLGQYQAALVTARLQSRKDHGKSR